METAYAEPKGGAFLGFLKPWAMLGREIADTLITSPAKILIIPFQWINSWFGLLTLFLCIVAVVLISLTDLESISMLKHGISSMVVYALCAVAIIVNIFAMRKLAEQGEEAFDAMRNTAMFLLWTFAALFMARVMTPEASWPAMEESWLLRQAYHSIHWIGSQLPLQQLDYIAISLVCIVSMFTLSKVVNKA